MTADAAALRFEPYRATLVRHAYRMLGDIAEAEDAVQDAYLRWDATVRARAIADDRAFLRATVTRLCLDRLRSARLRREAYVGPWLPEPLVARTDDDPEALAMLADDVSFALLLALERLSALERAAFLLHDVMDVSFAEIAETLGRSEDAVKQLASRARTHVREPGSRRGIGATAALRVRDAFADAIRRDDLAALQHLLADDVVFVSDSGGKVPAAMVPVRGPDHVSRLLTALARKAPPTMRFEPALVNGAPGFIISDGETVVQTLALEVAANDRIAVIYVTRNPDKLRAVPIARKKT